MRARAGLALSLWADGQHDEAIAHWRAVLILNPNDNQGIRYVLAARLLEGGRDHELTVLLKEHRDDGRAYLIWTNALLLFRTQGDIAKSRRALAEALESNRMFLPICWATSRSRRSSPTTPGLVMRLKPCAWRPRT
jgi:tetratricopeptide (TPR) repeat protein